MYQLPAAAFLPVERKLGGETKMDQECGCHEGEQRWRN